MVLLQKIVVKLEVNSGKDKQKAMKAVSALVGTSKNYFVFSHGS